MLTAYIQAAMSKAKYAILKDGSYYGEIPGFQGVWAEGDTLEACRRELQSVLEDWLILGLQLGHRLPRLPGVGTFPKPRKVAG
ncbi:MAG TPA: type II toxin-antitoxin system HicB family antitoxin [Phycisphaerae bacterium]|nr:type II toxin-antitoxin system HicB family antitoxin [Phycisphaerae bacterium]